MSHPTTVQTLNLSHDNNTITSSSVAGEQDDTSTHLLLTESKSHKERQDKGRQTGLTDSVCSVCVWRAGRGEGGGWGKAGETARRGGWESLLSPSPPPHCSSKPESV